MSDDKVVPFNNVNASPNNNVIGINGEEHHTSPEVRAKMVDTLQEALDRVKSGEMVGFALVRMHSDFCASWYVMGRVGGYGMLGAAQMVVSELVEVNQE